MPVFKAIAKWVRGWRLDKVFQHSPNGDISVKEASAKTIQVIDQTLALWTQYEPLFDSLVSNEGEASAERIKAEIEIIKAKLTTLETLPDISEELKDYRFAKDDERNDFYHSLVTSAALMFNDGQISIFEAVSFIVQIAVFIKDND